MLDGGEQLPDEELLKEEAKFNLEQANDKFVKSLQSATNGEQVRQVIEDLHGIYSDTMTDDSTTTMYMPMFIDALQNLKMLPKELQQTINMMDYDLVTTVLDGLSDEFIRKEDLHDRPEDTKEERKEKDKKKPSFQWAESIDQIFTEIGVLKD